MELIDEQEKQLLQQLEEIRAKKLHYAKIEEINNLINHKLAAIQQLREDIETLENDKLLITKNYHKTEEEKETKLVNEVMDIINEPDVISESVVLAINYLNGKFDYHIEEKVFVRNTNSRAGYAFYFVDPETGRPKKSYEGHQSIIKHLFKNFDEVHLKTLLDNKIFNKIGKHKYESAYDLKVYESYFSKDVKSVFNIFE